MRIRPRSFLTALCLIARVAASQGLASTTGDAGAAPVQDTGVLIDLAVHTLTGDRSITVIAIRRDEAALIPIGAFLSLGEIAVGRDTDGVVDFTIEPAGVRYHVDAARTVVTRDGKPLSPAPGSLTVLDGETYVESSQLAGWLGIRFEIAWNQLRITATGDQVLPVQRRIARAANRLIRPEQQPGALLGEPQHLARPTLDGFVVDYAVTVPLDTSIRSTGYVLSTGVNLLGGALDGIFSAPTGGHLQSEISWTQVWDKPLVSQLTLGSTLGVGLEPVEVNGFMLTNAPFVRPLPFGTVAFGTTLAPDWEVDTYVDGQLVAADSTDARGRFSHRLPVDFGSNPVDFIAYGPHGEQQQFQQLFQVFPQDFLPAGHVEYGLSAGRCVTTECRAVGDADLRVGITSRLSAETGLEWLLDSLRASSEEGYAALTMRPVNPLSLRLQWQAPGEGEITTAWQPNVDQSLGVEVARFGSAFNNPLTTIVPELGHTTVTYYLRPPWDGRTTYFTVDALRSVRTGSVLNEVRATTGLATPLGTFLPFVEHDLTTSDSVPNAATTQVGMNVLLSPAQTFGALGTAVAFGGIQRETGGLWSGGLTLGFQISASVRLETGAQWTAGGRGPVFTIRALSNLAQARTITTATAGPTRSASQFVAGTILGDPHGDGVSLLAGPELLRAGVGGRVYLDQNVDGQFDAGDIPLPGVVVRVGSAYAVTDSSGQYRVWDVAPFEPVPVAVDASSLENPLWSSDVLHAILRPWPNRLQTFDVAIVPGGVVEGFVLDSRTANAPALAGVRLILKEVGGNRSLQTSSFTDGSYSFLGVKPGHWELTVDPRDLAVLHGSAAPAPLTVRAVSDGDRVSVSVTVTAGG